MPPTPPKRLPDRCEDSHKGDYGRVVLIGGSQSMAGAIALSGMAALRSGAGLVTIGSPSSAAPIVASFDACYMTHSLAEDGDGLIAAGADTQVAALAEKATSLGIGPGLGRSAAIDRLVAHWYGEFEPPMVVDADGLNALAEVGLESLYPRGTRILTPHPGEFRRLTGQEFSSRAEMEKSAAQFALQHNLLLVLKGSGTIITNGQRTLRNSTGNAGMATGGAGDVLTGIIAALIAQVSDVFDAVQLAVHIHGSAGDLAAERLGHIALTAADICRSLPEAFCRHQQS